MGSVFIVYMVAPWWWILQGGYVVYMCYQLAFSIPGILPVAAHALKVILEMPNLRMYPLVLPVIWHLLRSRTRDAFLGSLSRAVWSPWALSSARLAA